MAGNKPGRRSCETGLVAVFTLVLLASLFFILTGFIGTQESIIQSNVHKLEPLHVIPTDVTQLMPEPLAVKGLIFELKEAEIIPTILDEFVPLLSVSVSWPSANAFRGNTQSPDDMQSAPTVQLVNVAPEAWAKWFGGEEHEDRRRHGDHGAPQLTVVMTDPDAPEREHPLESEYCHWIATGFHLSASDASARHSADESQVLEELMPYLPPGPPPHTGKHRYIFAALVPTNGTTEKLNLRAPLRRPHWGYEAEREGLKRWAHEMGLTVVGANFLYAQNQDQ